MKIGSIIAAACLLFPAAAGPLATAHLIDGAGHEVGVAHFKAAPHGVLIDILASGLPPGPHAVLLHGNGACDPAGGFASAGPVLEFEAGRGHGYFAKNGPKPGDLPQAFAAADGSLHADFYSTAISLGVGKRSIFRPDGVSIVIHAGGDDYQSQAEGRAGVRLACGSISRSGSIRPHRK